jgi:hypothetical protein
MIDCREASRLISQNADRPLPLGRRIQLRLHLFLCDACSNFSRQVRQVRRAVNRLF